jgi:hypothetical protein
MRQACPRAWGNRMRPAENGLSYPKQAPTRALPQSTGAENPFGRPDTRIVLVPAATMRCQGYDLRYTGAMKTAVSIPDKIFRAADRLAKRKGLSRSELYARAVAALVRQEDESEVTAQLNRIYSTSDSALDPALAALPGKVLDKEDW